MISPLWKGQYLDDLKNCKNTEDDNVMGILIAVKDFGLTINKWILQDFIDAGLDLDEPHDSLPGEDTNNLLEYACEYRDVALVKSCLECGADANYEHEYVRPDYRHETPLELAFTGRGDWMFGYNKEIGEIVKLLMQYKAKPVIGKNCLIFLQDTNSEEEDANMHLPLPHELIPNVKYSNT